MILAVIAPDRQSLVRENIGHGELEFTDVADARQYPYEQRILYDLLLLDLTHYSLSELAGLREVYAEHPILAIVGENAFDEGAGALDYGADDYLVQEQITSLLARRVAHHGRSPAHSAEYVLQKAVDGMLIVDGDGVIRMVNPAAAELIGRTRENLIGQVFGYPISTGENTEIDIIDPRSTSRVVEMAAVKIRWRGQDASLAMLRDVTGRIQAEQELRLRDRAIHASSSAIFILDVTNPTWRFTFANPAFTHTTGYSAEEVLGHGYELMLELHEKVPMPGELLSSFDEEGERVTTTISYHQSGERYWSELRYSPIYNDVGRLSHIVVVQNDITQTKILEKERLHNEKIQVALQKERELNQIKDRFLETMAHELHTPLASIMLSYDMLHHYGHRSSEEERAEFLDNIRQQVNRLNAIVNDVLDISRTQDGVPHISPENVDLVQLCRKIYKAARKKYKNTRKISFQAESDAIRAAVDREMLKRAVENLLENAVKYSKTGGEVELAIYSGENEVVIEVTDDGIGIPDEDRARLFDPFHRGTNVGNLSGTGLGLTIVQQVVRGHQGQVEIESELGSGTQFRLRLPTAISI